MGVTRARIVERAHDLVASLAMWRLEGEAAERRVAHQQVVSSSERAFLVEGVPDVEQIARALDELGLPHGRASEAVIFRASAVGLQALRGRLLGRPTPDADLVVEALDAAVRGWDRGARDLVWPGGRLELSRRAHLMGIVNVTPDSFSDGGLYLDADAAVKHGLRLVEEGADLLDVGGESTRPGADPVDDEEETRRVVPVIEALAGQVPVPISIDTTKAEVARAALDAGAQIVNDVSAGRFDDAMLPLVAERAVPVVLMHMLGDPRTMQGSPTYRDVVGEIAGFLAERAALARAAGVDPARIVVDPGFGFGKTRGHNLVVLRRLRELACLGHPVLAGTSRKSFIGLTLDLPVEERLEGTAATVALAVANGASILRVHDVGPMRRVAGMVEAVMRSTERGET